MRLPQFQSVKRVIVTYLALSAAVIWHYYPSRTDAPEAIHFEPTPEQQIYYNVAFDPEQAKYEAFAALQAERIGIPGAVAKFVAQYDLKNKHVLEVGSGAGLLQDMVADYTGLDISATARVKYHKRFVQADARAMPFPDGEFDALWSIWVLEHVPNPEQALREIRRVLKPNGVAYLLPAWNASDLSPQGYRVRPYSDFGLGGKLIKASAPVQDSDLFQAMHILPTRFGRWAVSKAHGQPTALHYRPITPNYEKYWDVDADAVNAIDVFETYLWFRSRGDQCLNCLSEAGMMRVTNPPLIIRKTGA